MLRARLLPTILIAFVAGAVIALALWARIQPPRLTETQVREAVWSALHEERDTSFVITGYIDITATTQVADTRVLFPGILNLPLGTTRATVRVPGRISYGFDPGLMTPEMIRVFGDTIEVELPDLAVYSTEPDLSRLDVETTTGWARFRVTAQEAERRAVQQLNDALRAQGESYVRSAVNARVNTATTMRTLLDPPLRSLGIEEPKYRIRIGGGLLLDPAER
jgi:hypothetical protein